MAQTTHILFDLGRVLVDLDGLPSVRPLFPNLSDDQIIEKWSEVPSRKDYETGKIPTSEFLEIAPKEFGLDLNPAEFHDLFRSWAGDVYPGVVELLDRLRGDFTLGCLSNICEIHSRRYREAGLFEHFDDVYLSHEIGFLKPDTQAFEFVLEDWGVSPSAVLFLDDNRENIAAAESLGMKAKKVLGVDEAKELVDANTFGT